MKRTIRLVLFGLMAFFTTQVAAQGIKDMGIEEIEKRLDAFPEIGPVKVKKNVATSGFSCPLSFIRDSLHRFTREELAFVQTAQLRSGGYLEIDLINFSSPAGIDLFDNGLNYSLTSPQVDIKKIYSQGNVFLCHTDEKKILPAENADLANTDFGINNFGTITTSAGNSVDSMEVLYSYAFCTRAEVIPLSVQHPSYQQGEESIYLDVDGNWIELKVNYPAFERIVRIEGRDAKNKRMMPDLSWTAGYMVPEIVRFYTEAEIWKSSLEPESEQESHRGYPMKLNFPSPPSEIHVFLSTEKDSIQGECMVYRIPNKEEDYRVGVFYKSDKAGVIDIEGNILVEPIFHDLTHEGGIVFYGQKEEDDRSQLFKLDRTHKALIPLEYTYARPTSNDSYCDGLLKVCQWIKENDSEDEKLNYGVINYQGEIVVPVIYKQVGTCLTPDGGLIVAWKQLGDSHYHTIGGIYNSRGEELLPFIYDKFNYENEILSAHPEDYRKPTEFYRYNPETQQLYRDQEILMPESGSE